MYILAGIAFLIIGITMLMSPDLFYQLTERWKSAAGGEPSKIYRVSLRVGGVMFCLVGLLAMVSVFLV